jgi:hypothetical protein
VEWIIIELAMKGARTIEDLRPIFDRDSDHPDILNVIKQLGFYSDCYGNAHWSEPHEVIDEKLARSIVLAAKVLVPKHDTSEREIELWIEHVGRHWAKPEMFAGAVAFQQALIDEGLSRHSIQEVRDFFGIAA